ncbi:MAG TPA: TonB-dependent receptor plug domain-containing protein, partial [Ferruginibacter sp.]|nr:TonB-dependent receptor plug domain-containing protein [Ferruginibacter sp.]
MRKLILILSAVFVFVLQAAAQNRTVTGKVTNDNGAPIEGVSVTSTDGKHGTQTDKDGNFSISIPASVKTLNFSNVNFEPQSKSIGTDLTVNVALKIKDNSLQEVVVVGYGTQQKKAFTGSASKIDTKEFATLVTPSVDRQLAGRAAGVQVTTSGGLVNTPAVIRVRGIQSITGNNNPLVVVDGTPIITGNLAFATNSNALGDINPADIETIDVLKDGSATAIFGSRAAGGVILITTKKGVKGRSRITYEGTVGYSSPSKKFSLLKAADFVTIANEKFTNAGLTARANTNPTSPLAAETDWQTLVMNNNAPSQTHTLSFSGGTDKTTIYFSLNYSDQKGIVISNYNKAYRARMNVEHEANKFIKIGNNIAVSRQQDGDQNNGSNSLGGSIASTLRLLPNVSPYNSAGWEGYNITYAITGGTNSMASGPNAQSVDDNFFNVLYTMKRNKFYSDKYRIIDNAFVELSPFKGFKFRSQVGID